MVTNGGNTKKNDRFYWFFFCFLDSNLNDLLSHAVQCFLPWDVYQYKPISHPCGGSYVSRLHVDRGETGLKINFNLL